MSKRTEPKRKAKVTKSGLGLKVERLEDRCVPHTGVTLFSAGISPNAAASGIVSGPDGNFWFTEFGTDRIARTTPTGEITEFTLSAGRGPLNITVGPDNNLWFTESTGDRIGRINPLAGSTASIQASLAEFVIPGAGSAPNDIISGPDGALWFTESGSDEIGRITTAGVVTNEYAVPGVGSTPAGIAAGADGALWFTQAGSGQIGRVSTTGVVTEFQIPVNASGVSDPEDIVAGPGGNLFFTDFGRDQIGRITPSGQITQFNLPVGRGPHDLVAFGDGDLYFTESSSGRIGRLPASALAVGAPTSGSPPLEEFDFVPAGSVPLGLTISPAGDIWFTLNNGNAVGSFLAHLQQLTATATGPTVRVFDVKVQPVRTFDPFPGFKGNLSLAVADTNRNGIPDVIVAAGAGGGPHVKVYDGSDNRLLASFYAFDPSYSGGVTVGSDDINGDGYADIVVTTGAGSSSQVKVIDGTKLNQLQANGQIADSALLASFFAFDEGFKGGLSLAVGDVNRDGISEVIIGAGAGGGPQVKVIDGTKLTQQQAGGVIADSALLGSFFAYNPVFAGGVTVGFSKNVFRRDLIVGAGPGGGPHVKIIDGTKLTQTQTNGQIADSALLASFFAFDPGFAGGVNVAADDLNFDGSAEAIVAAGPGGGPHVKIIDGSKLNQPLVNNAIADSTLLASFYAGDSNFSGGVTLASDADHRDGTVFGTPGVTIGSSRRDINDAFIFQSPTNPDNTVLILDVSPFSTASTPASFEPGVLYDFRISNRDLTNVTDDLTFRATFGPADANGVQDVALRALPAARFAGSAGVIVKGFTKQNLIVRGVGAGSGAAFRAGEQDDPFFFDAGAFNKFLNGGGLSDGTPAGNTAGKYPSGTSNAGLGDTNGNGLGFDANEPVFDYNGTNFFANANTLALTLEIPSAVLAGLRPGTPLVAEKNAIGFWARTEAGGVQQDRIGRPAINTALIPPVPRGSNFPIAPGTDLRNSFNLGHPRDDLKTFGAAVTGVLASVYPIGGNGQASAIAGLLLPDILVYDPTSKAGFFGGTIGTLGQPSFFLAGGRKLSDDVISTELSILTDPDSPFNLDGGVNQVPLVLTQNVADDNGLNLQDGSIIGPGSALSGMKRSAVFPYIGAPNAKPSGVPGGNPPA